MKIIMEEVYAAKEYFNGVKSWCIKAQLYILEGACDSGI